MLRITRAFVWLSACGALLLVAYLNGGAVPLLLLTAGAFAVATITARIRVPLAIELTLFSVYLTPAAFRVLAGHNAYGYVTPWLAALAGLIAATSPSAPWSLPARWRWPLVLWALTVAVSWPLVAWRELDFGMARLAADRLPIAGIKIAPAGATAWIAHTASIQLVGFLWLDWLFLRYRSDGGPSLKKEIVAPLGAGILTACVVAVYQSVFDIGFASGHAWPSIHRATGTLMDANVFGMIAALWGPAFIVLGLGTDLALPIAGAAALLTWAGVWMSASRTALLAAVVGTLIAAISIARDKTVTIPRWRVLVTIAAAVLVLFVVAQFIPLSTTTAVERNQYLVPSLSWSSVGHTIHELWDRDGYGSAAAAMIGRFPFTGVGVGCFHLLGHDFQMEATGISIPPDNAQNWFRHQLAELGLLGSVGWIVWVFAFAPQLWPSRHRLQRPGEALRGPIIAFVLASLLGMPSQDAAVTLTFWLLVFWYAMENATTTATDRRLSRTAWAVMLVLVGGYAVALALPNDLRPPFRAARFNFPYTYGMDFESPAQVWTAKHGVTVLDASGKWLKVTVWVDHPDADRKPVEVDVWKDHLHVVNQRVFLRQRITRYVPVSEGQRFVLEAKVDRTFRPSDFGSSSDNRELGLSMKWEFLPAPPK